MYIFIVVVHVIACLILICTILLQAGRGAGLAEAFGGGETAQSFLGTQAPALLKKATSYSAILFILTSLSLGMLTARKGRSLFDGAGIPTGAPIRPISVPEGNRAQALPIQPGAKGSTSTDGYVYSYSETGEGTTQSAPVTVSLEGKTAGTGESVPATVQKAVPEAPARDAVKEVLETPIPDSGAEKVNP